MDKRVVGVVLLCVAGVAVVAGLLLWANASETAEQDQLTEDFTQALGGGPAEEVEPDRVPAYASFAVAVVAALAGAMFLSQAEPRDRAEPEPVDPDITPT